MTEQLPHISLHELDHRSNDGIEVSLLWDERDGSTLVLVNDLKSGDLFELRVAPEHAADAFKHPYAYAAAHGLEYSLAKRASDELVLT